MYRSSFSMIELVIVIVIVGILVSVAVPRLIIGREDACYAKLRASLNETEAHLTKEYTKKFLQGLPVSDNERMQLLREIEKDNSSDGKCGFMVNNANRITANINKINVVFEIKSDAKTKFPVLTCDNKINACKRIVGKN